MRKTNFVIAAAVITILSSCLFIKKAVFDKGRDEMNEDTLTYSYSFPNVESGSNDVSKLGLEEIIQTDEIVRDYKDETMEEIKEVEFLGEKYELKYVRSTSTIRKMQNTHTYQSKDASERVEISFYDDGSLCYFYNFKLANTGEKEFISDEECKQIAIDCLKKVYEKINLDGYTCKISNVQNKYLEVDFVKCVGELEIKEFYKVRMTPSGEVWKIGCVNIGSFDDIDMEKLSENKISQDSIVEELKDEIKERYDKRCDKEVESISYEGSSFYITKDGKITRELLLLVYIEGEHEIPVQVFVQLDKEGYLQ